MDELNFPKKKQRELALLSTFIFVLIALLLRFLVTVQETLMMDHFQIGYLYHPFGNLFGRPGPRGNWSEWKVIYVFSVAPAIGLLVGIMLTRVLTKSKKLSWRPRLALTWLAFFLLNAIPMGMLLGVFFYADFGYAFQNMFYSVFMRLAIAVIAVALAIFSRPFWLHLFLKTAPGHRYTIMGSLYLKVIFILPWIFGTIIIGAFAIIGGYWAWLSSLVLLGLVVLPIINRLKPDSEIELNYSKSRKAFQNRVVYYLYIILIVAQFLFALYWRLK